MLRRILIVELAVLGIWLAGGAEDVFAQGLIWSLPKEDGTWVRYEGTYKQVEIRGETTEGNLEIEWIRHLTIKSVGHETAPYNGTMTPCRWIEIKLVTGKPSESGIDPGPIGARIYKVLVPENRVIGKVTDEKIHVSYLPIVKGFRKIGDGDVKEISAKALQIYPLLSLLMHYKTLRSDSAEATELDVPLGAVTARKFIGEQTMESKVSRSENKGELWRSDDVPFGLAKWTVKMVRYAKDSREPRSIFEKKRVSEVTVDMSAHEVGTEAQSEVAVPDEESG